MEEKNVEAWDSVLLVYNSFGEICGEGIFSVPKCCLAFTARLQPTRQSFSMHHEVATNYRISRSFKISECSIVG
jgi:hypothetical protein